MEIAKIPQPPKVTLGGRTHILGKACLLLAQIDHKPLQLDSCVIGKIGMDEAGREIEILFGALMSRNGV